MTHPTQTSATSTGSSEPVELTAPAKLTLSLRVRGIRSDGYHLLESEMVTLDLADTLLLGAGDGLTVSSPSVGAGPDDDRSPRPGEPAAEEGAVPWWRTAVSTGPDNLVVRALAAIGRTSDVQLIKRIPPGAGLGGGSADAAAILRWGGCSGPAVAASLGADVPFCVAGGRALVRGIGEEVVPLPYEDRRFVLLLPPFGVDTRAVYRAWDELTEFGRRPGPTGHGNDLEPAAVVVEPRLTSWKAALAEVTGAAPRLAGSGSTWFVEGTPDELGLTSRHWLALGAERAQIVPVRTIRPFG